MGNEVGGADEYHRHRISYGIPEGSREIPPAQCLPFEVNIDLMKGGRWDLMKMYMYLFVNS